MKHVLSLVLLLLMANSKVTGQEIFLSTYYNDYYDTDGTLLPERKVTYEYDFSGNEIRKTTWFWDETEETYYIVGISDKEYSGGRLVKSTFTRLCTNTSDTCRYITKEYFINPQTTYYDSIMTLTYIVDTQIPNFKDTEVYDGDQLVSEIQSWWSVLEEKWKYDFRMDYRYEDNQTTMERYHYSTFENDWLFTGSSIRRYDDTENPVYTWSDISDIGAENECYYEYDDQNHSTLVECKMRFDETQPFKTTLIREYENTHNTEGLIVNKHIVRAAHYDFFDDRFNWEVFGGDIEYTYYCDNKLKHINHKDAMGLIYREEQFQYNIRPVCIGVEQDDFLLEAYPNPFLSTITIRSEALKPENCQVQVFDAKGALIKSFPIPERINEVELDLQALPFGSYFVRILGQDNYGLHKIIKN